MERIARSRRDRTEVSCVIKYLVFGFNVVFWLLGGALAAAGLWAWSEKDMFSNLKKLTEFPDPAFLLIIGGFVIFLIGFFGCVGALRENTRLLLFYCLLIGIIFASQLVLGILIFVYKDWFASQVKTSLLRMLVNYREDTDLQNVIDWVQKDWLKCCGVDQYDDWELNEYFNCSSPSVEKCGVPFSCCKFDPAVAIENTQCGFGARDARRVPNPGEKIYTDGCIKKGEQWLNDNLVPVAGVVVAVALLQILGICFAQNLRTDIFAQMARWSQQHGV